MKRWLTLVVMLCAATGAFAQATAETSKPEEPATAVTPYSRDNLQRVFSANGIDLPPRPEPNVRYGIGYVEFRALGMDWRVTYLPIMIPLSGTAMRTQQQMVDPFALTGAEYATTPRTFQLRRDLNRERKRIARTEKARLKVQNQ